ncbi:hypothetical protein GCM10014719_01360 [Planomonospora parontospora subsp. antibiotica]|nr:hypothetical protein GCM10014719_01360 [Planomonospora parontospora subsp. antibiotica]
MPELSAMAQRISGLPKGVFKMPDKYFEKGLRKSSSWTSPDFEIIEGSMWSVSPGIAGSIIQSTFQDFCDAKSQEDDSRRTLSFFELSTWIEARVNGASQPSDVRGAPPGVDVHSIGDLIGKSEREQIAWATGRLEQIAETPCAE